MTDEDKLKETVKIIKAAQELPNHPPKLISVNWVDNTLTVKIEY